MTDFQCLCIPQIHINKITEQASNTTLSSTYHVNSENKTFKYSYIFHILPGHTPLSKKSVFTK